MATQEEEQEVIDISLVNSLDGNWRDILRENPDAPEFATPPTAIYLEEHPKKEKG